MLLKKLLKAKVHLGHKVSVSNPNFKFFVKEIRNKTQLIDLVKTVRALRVVLLLLIKISRKNGCVLFLGSSTNEKGNVLVSTLAGTTGSLFLKKWYYNSWDTLIWDRNGIKISKAPDLIIVFNTLKFKNAIKEAKNFGIPIVGIVDSTSYLKGINYIIPGNDDSLKALFLYCQLFKKSFIEGYKLRIADLKNQVRVNKN